MRLLPVTAHQALLSSLRCARPFDPVRSSRVAPAAFTPVSVCLRLCAFGCFGCAAGFAAAGV